MLKFLFLTIIYTIQSSLAIAQDFGVIPLSFKSNPAKDLYYVDGDRTYTRRELLSFAEGGYDLSFIDPIKSDIWNGEKQDISQVALDDVGINEDATYDYVSKIASPIGAFRFSIRSKSEQQQKNFAVWIAKDSRSILLRKNMLRKLGYKAPKTKHVNKLKLKFRGLISLKAFISEMEVATFADSKRWTVEINEKEAILTLQDALIIESNFTYYNLTTGEIPASIIGHRRALNALNIPIAITDVRESVDGLGWNLGVKDNNQLILGSIGAEAYTTTYQDARWILRRMAQFTHKDFEEIVENSFYPKSVGMLLVEKLKSRFLSLYQHFNLDPISESKLSVNPNISDSTGELKKGRLTRDKWPGHAARYSFDDTESPLSQEEMHAYFRSKVYASATSNVVNYLNDKFLYSTDIQAQAMQKAVEAQKQQLIHLLQTGEFKKIPFTAWAIPTGRGNINASRDIVTGSYLGTDNRIQIADSIEFVGGAGVFIGTQGLPSEFAFYAAGGAQFSRSYTHVKAIRSIKKALKEPFRNILVPRYKRQKSRTLQEIIDQLQTTDFDSMEEDEQAAKLTEITNTLKDVLAVGESFIISNNLVLSGSVTGGVSVEIVDAMLNFSVRKINLWRFHLVRSDENTIQIYKSRAGSLGAGLGFQLKAVVPIVTLNLNANSGKVRTTFNTISINKNQGVEDLVRNLTELRQVMVQNSTELLRARKKPFEIRHKFSEKTSDFQFFASKDINVALTDKVSIKHPDNFSADLLLRSRGRLKGKDYQQVAVDVLNGLIEEIFDTDSFGVDNPSSGIPGDTYGGKSFSRLTTYEEPLNVKGTELPFTPYSEIKMQWRGWKAGPQTLANIQAFIKEKYGENVFSDDIFRGTKEIQLYNADLSLSIYDDGIDNLLGYDRRWFEQVLESYLEIPKFGKNERRRSSNYHTVRRYEDKRKRIISRVSQAYKYLNPENRASLSPEDRAKKIELVINVCEMMLPFEIFSKLLGGSEYYYLKGYINGFRVGVENGEEPLVSHSLGEYGSEFTKGTFNTLREAIKISQGELGAYWFLRRLQ